MQLPDDFASSQQWISDSLTRGPLDGWQQQIPQRSGLNPACPAAVLIPLVWQPENGLSVLLTRRSEQLANHPGQISFPGGKQEKSDTGAIAAALREAEEEVGLRQADVTVLGTLPTYVTITRFAVVPVVGLLTGPLTLEPESSEVVEVFQVPLAHVLQPPLYARHRFERDGVVGHYLSLSYRRYFIWGATAAMLRLLAWTLMGE